MQVDSYALRGTAYTLSAYDAFGRQMATSDGSAIDLSFCDNGIYYVSVNVEGKKPVRKRVVIMK